MAPSLRPTSLQPSASFDPVAQTEKVRTAAATPTISMPSHRAAGHGSCAAGRDPCVCPRQAVAALRPDLWRGSQHAGDGATSWTLASSRSMATVDPPGPMGEVPHRRPIGRATPSSWPSGA
ncbi:hypothetical protein ZWY2020_040115 [Hordeum vulgare]|nr:hypothetical protein ZWY2020_059587 [Hordeum vulgare]KAI4991729.1 hypothetical protein ZWY2020_040115 [Hordeum vulgare]